MTNSLNPSNRIYGLDILRALAILFVVAGHRGNLIPKVYFKYINLFVFDGVSIFFVLSGFLIGGILIKTLNNSFNIRELIHFWCRRWLRTLPNYFLILSVLLLLNFLFTDNFNISHYLKYFLFLQNIYSPHPPFFSEAWSLSIEEWFYITTPLFLFLFVKTFRFSVKSSLVIAIVGFIVAITLYRHYQYSTTELHNVKEWDLLFRKLVITRLDSLMFGILGAYIRYYHIERWKKNRIHLFLLGILLLIIQKFNLWKMPELGLFECVYSFTTVSIATLFLFPFLTSIKSGSGYIYAFITYTSLLSYSMYLLNLSIVQEWIIGKIDWSYLSGYSLIIVRYSFYWIATYLLSFLLYKYFELPIMNLRDKTKQSII